MKTRILTIAGIILTLFGLITIFMAGSVIFDLFGIRAKEGNYVPFVVWANFICGFIYVLAAYGFFSIKTWTVFPLIIALAILIVAFGGLLIHINSGGLHETKTVAAMLFRTAVTLAFTLLAYFKISRRISVK